MIPITKTSLFCLLTLSTVLVAQDHDLSIPAKKGSTVWLSKVEKMEQTIDMGGQEMEIGRETTTVMQCTVKDVDDKGMLVVETKIARIHGTMTIPMAGDVEFDSAAPSQDDDDGGDEDGFGMPSSGAIAKSQTMLAGKSFVAKVDSKGKVASLEGVAELLKAGKGGGGMMPQGPTETDLRRLVEGAFGNVPDKAVAVGGTWDHKTGEGSGMPGVSMKLTLAKVDDDTFEVTSTGTIDPPKTDGGDDPRAKMMESMKIVSSKSVGSQHISRKDGFVLDASHTVEMDATMESPMGGEMSMKVKASTTTKRTTADAAMPAKAEAAPK
ncbi:MAG: hypothetical protein JNM25_07830 [Planctomycetes bacterium]|nr:hypothetical protein [Planctomycetota bacterium]